MLGLLAGEPQLVIVDARVLQLLMGDLANLIILGEAGSLPGGTTAIGHLDEPYFWDDINPCEESPCAPK